MIVLTFFTVTIKVVIILLLLFATICLMVGNGRGHLEEQDYLKKRLSMLHKGQKYGDQPYVYHLEKVAETVTQYLDFYGDDIELKKALIVAAWFHDSLEDCYKYKYADLKKDVSKCLNDDDFYTKMVSEIVYACTAEKGRNRAEREGERYFEGIRNTGYAPFIKACDRLANISNAERMGEEKLLKMYKKEMPMFLNSISAEDNRIPPGLRDELCRYLVD